MTNQPINHTTREVNKAVKVARVFGQKVYWRNPSVNTVWQVKTARSVKGQLQVRVNHPIFGGTSRAAWWYAVDANDQIFQQ